jgi:hypothetical protein
VDSRICHRHRYNRRHSLRICIFMSAQQATSGSARVARAGEPVLAIVNFPSGPTWPSERRFEKRLFRRAAAATDAKRRPGFQTSTPDAYAP